MIAVRLSGFCPDCCSYGTCDCTRDEKIIKILRTALETIASHQAGTVDAGMSPWTAKAALEEADKL